MDRSEVFEWCILHFGVLTLVICMYSMSWHG